MGSLIEVETQWSPADIMDGHEALDSKEDAEAKAYAEAKRKASQRGD